MSTSVSVSEINDASTDPPVRGFLHLPNDQNGEGIVLTHGAGSNSRSKLLTALADAFALTGFRVLRCDLPFRQHRSQGPPFAGNAATDRAGLRQAVRLL
ncbi:MAG TPA: alpha/beta hydrolase, partial [Candidatus Angelobacter sp.]|nr:alpha/beta hydrolase [Candidatus Angelobacter sp.]